MDSDIITIRPAMTAQETSTMTPEQRFAIAEWIFVIVGTVGLLLGIAYGVILLTPP